MNPSQTAAPDWHRILSPGLIDAALPNVATGLQKYLRIQHSLEEAQGPVSADADFRRQFNGFYRVRRNNQWQDAFYSLLDQCRCPTDFATAFQQLHQATGRHEASFVSKLVATVDPNQPVIDSVVLSNLGLKLPLPNSPDRSAKICALYQQMQDLYYQYLNTEEGRYLVTRFREVYPEAKVTEVKMLDLVLWQSRN